jgi:hypothetical protein
MTWHSATIPMDGLASLLTSIRSLGGTITSSRPQPSGVGVTWTTAVADPVDPDRSDR